MCKLEIREFPGPLWETRWSCNAVLPPGMHARGFGFCGRPAPWVVKRGDGKGKRGSYGLCEQHFQELRAGKMACPCGKGYLIEVT